MSLKFNNTLNVNGILSIKVIDAVTGKILEEDSGQNLILNSGIDIMCRALAGDVSIPVTTAETKLHQLTNPLSNIVQYIQLGNNLTPPTISDSSPFPSGALNLDPASGNGASEVFKLIPVFGIKDTISFKCIIPNSAGNGSSGTALYQEAVLMTKTSDVPTYKWFARKVFGGVKTKNSGVIFEINWDIVFSANSVS
jgi:hypothetical protein